MPLTPPRDAAGKVVPHDDPAINGASYLIRHVDPVWHVTTDENGPTPRKRISSTLFSCTNRDPDHALSVDLGQLLIEAGLSLTAKVSPEFGAIKFTAADARSFGTRVGSEPIDGNAFHGEVWGVNDSKKKRLHRSLTYDWEKPMPGVDLR